MAGFFSRFLIVRRFAILAFSPLAFAPLTNICE